MKSKVIVLIRCVFGLLLSVYLMDLYLNSNFKDNGEAFFKGEGHLLQENFYKGIFYVIMLHFFIALFLTIIFINFFPRKFIKISFAIMLAIGIIAFLLLAFYLLTQIKNIQNHLVTNERVLEITTTGLSALLGQFIAYLITNKYLNVPGGTAANTSLP